MYIMGVEIYMHKIYAIFNLMPLPNIGDHMIQCRTGFVKCFSSVSFLFSRAGWVRRMDLQVVLTCKVNFQQEKAIFRLKSQVSITMAYSPSGSKKWQLIISRVIVVGFQQKRKEMNQLNLQ